MLNTITRPRILMGTSALATVALAVVLTQNLGPSPRMPLMVGDTPAEPAHAPAPGAATTDAEIGNLASQPLIEPMPAEQESFEAAEAGARSDGALANSLAGADADETVSRLINVPESRRANEIGQTAEVAPQSEPAPPAAPADARERSTTVVGGEADDRGQGIADGVASLKRLEAPSTSRERAPQMNQRDLLGIEEVAPPGAVPRMMIRPEPTPPVAESSTESYPQAVPNALKLTSVEPVSTFSIDVDTASYALVRSSLKRGQMPPRDAVRVEEVINYFDYAYPMPDSREAPFATSVSVAQTPWNPDTRLMHIGIQGYDLAAEDRPPLNLVFLIDTSGSMNDRDKLALLIPSFKLLLDSLSEDDSVAIVTYAGSAGMALEPTPASDRATILRALDNLRAGGSTAGQAGLQQAYALAEQMREDGEVSRVILATDGDFNVGISDPEALKDYIADQRDSGTYLSVLGFGRGNYQDTTMQALAQNGNGVAAYIDTLAEAQKVLVEDVSGSLFPIAGDVKIQVEFNPAQISEYRLIGYETRALNREDFNDDTVDAGEIGAGHQVTALYEITPRGSPAERISELRYAQEPETAVDASAEYAFVKLRYKRPGEGRSNLVETPVLPDRADIDPRETRFAAAAAGFGMLLRGETLPGWSYDDARALAASARGEDPYGYRSEMVSLIGIADALD